MLHVWLPTEDVGVTSTKLTDPGIKKLETSVFNNISQRVQSSNPDDNWLCHKTPLIKTSKYSELELKSPPALKSKLAVIILAGT